MIFPLAVKFTSEGDDHVSGSPRQSAAAEGAASKDFVPLGTGTALFVTFFLKKIYIYYTLSCSLKKNQTYEK